MASSGTIYSNKAAGSFTSSGTTYTFTDAQWYISWSQTKSSHGQSTVSFTVWTTKTNSSPRNLTAGGTITITATTGSIASGDTSLTFTKTGRSFAKSGGNNYVQQALADDGSQSFSFKINHTNDGAATFKVAFNMNCAGYTAAGGGSATLDTNNKDFTLTLSKGTGISSVSGGGTKQGGASVTATASVLPGYSFSKWTNSSGTQLSTSASYSFTMPKANTTYTANASVKGYTFTFNAQGGTVSPTTKSVTYGSIATGLPTPTKSGHTFKGWYANMVGNNYYNLGRNYMYTDKISVHVEAYMDSWANFTDMRLISCTESGGWNIEPNGSYVQFAGYDSGVGYKTASTSVTWASLGSGWHTFDLVFDGSKLHGYIDGVLKASSTAYSSGKIGYNANNVVILGAEAGNTMTAPAGAYFIGKLRNVVIEHSNTRITSALNKFIIPAENITLHADWAINTYQVSYSANGGSSTPSAQTKTYGVALTLADAISRTASTKPITTTFNGNGGTVSKSTVSSTATNSYTFTKWKATDGTLYNAKGSYTANAATTMTAQWTEHAYEGATITLPDASRKGYTFNGWYTASTGGTKKTSYSPNENTTLYAQWTAISYTLTIVDELSGNTISQQSINYDQTITLPTIPKDLVYSLCGNNIVTFSDSYQGTHSKALYIYGKYIANTYVDGSSSYTTTYTHTKAADVTLTLKYQPNGTSMRYEVQAPSCNPTDYEHVLYWQKTSSSDSRLPKIITPGSVATIDFDGNYTTIPSITGSYSCVYAPRTLGRTWVKQDGIYKLGIPLFKVGGQFARGDAYYVKHNNRWMPLDEYLLEIN